MAGQRQGPGHVHSHVDDDSALVLVDVEAPLPR